MEWYESLFLQVCGHVLTQAKVSTRRDANGVPVFDNAATRDLVDSYRRGVALAFSLPEVKQKLLEGADCVLLLSVHEHQFSNTLQDIKRQQDVMLNATLRTDVRSNEYATYHVDVAVIRATVSSPMDIAH